MSEPTPAAASTDRIFDLNGTKVPLVPQERPVYAWLAEQAYGNLRKPEPLPPLQGLLAMMAVDGIRQQVPTDDPRVQAVLNTLWAYGIDRVSTEGEGERAQVKWDVGTHPTIAARPVVEHFTEEGIAEGRAAAAALTIMLQRRIKLVNGIGGGEREFPVRLVDMQLKDAQFKRLRELFEKSGMPGRELPTFIAAQLFQMLGQGATPDTDLAVRAAIEIMADFGVHEAHIFRDPKDPKQVSVRIAQLNDMAVLAAEFLRGRSPGELADIARQLQRQRDEANAAATKAPGKSPGAGVGAAGTGAETTAPGGFKRRRRS